jgi:hypothetical protein
MSDEPVHIHALHGVSLSAFLQMLEQERTSCTVTVAAEHGGTGHFFFRAGKLIDADWDGKAGLKAAHDLLALQKTDFSVSAAEDRMARINQPLAKILMQTDAPMEVMLPGEESFAEEVKDNARLRHLLTELTAMPTVKHYCLLNRKGKLAACSTENVQFSNLISYTVMCSLQVRKGLGSDAKGPSRIQMLLRSGDALLIQPGAGMIIGLMADGKTRLPELSAKIRALLAH